MRAKDVPYTEPKLGRTLSMQSIVFRNELAKIGHRRTLN